MTVLFAVVIALAAVSSLGVVFSRQTIYSALSLVLTVSMLAVLFLLLRQMNKLISAKPQVPATPEDVLLLREIRDSLKTRG